MDEPLYPQALLGFRAWALDADGTLRGVVYQDHWRRLERAVCHLGAGHRPPAQGCGCGLYAFHDFWRAEQTGAALTFSYRAAVGAIAGRGPVSVHADGFRCAEAQILALFLPDRYLASDTGEALRCAARRYRVPALRRKEFLAYVRDLAVPAPDGLRPQGRARGQSAPGRGCDRSFALLGEHGV